MAQLDGHQVVARELGVTERISWAGSRGSQRDEVRAVTHSMWGPNIVELLAGTL